MHGVHGIVGSVEVGRVIRRDAHSIDVLDKVLAVSQLEQLTQQGDRSDKLGVGSVHQFDSAHLLERNRPELGYYVINAVLCHCDASCNLITQNQYNKLRACENVTIM